VGHGAGLIAVKKKKKMMMMILTPDGNQIAIPLLSIP
jgi:hypothetical protein